MNRREALKCLPFMGCAAAAKEQDAMSFEDELRQILFNSPHLMHIAAGSRVWKIWMDGLEIPWASQAYASPRQDTPVRGAVSVYIDKNGNAARSSRDIFCVGDEIATEWRIGEVTWVSMRKPEPKIVVKMTDSKAFEKAVRKNGDKIRDILNGRRRQ